MWQRYFAAMRKTWRCRRCRREVCSASLFLKDKDYASRFARLRWTQLADGDFDPDEAPTALLTAATTNAGFLSKVLVNP